jgi:O-antigen/teichoic acid export membrane protein
MDKIILSRLVSLELFGYYVLAGTVATSISLLAAAFFSAFYPRLTQLLSLGDEEGLSELYHHSCQLMSVVILSVAAFIACFSKEILVFWTGNPMTAANTHLILTLLVMGTAVNGLLYLPIALQLAYGWTKLTFHMNLLALVFVTPSIVVMASLYGAVGAAIVWVVVNAGLALVVIPLMHRRILKGEQWKWYFEDVGLPLAASLGAAVFCLTLVPTDGPRLRQLIVLMGVTIFIAGSAALATPVTRLAIISYFRSKRGRVLDVS